MNLVKMAWRNVWRNSRRSLITIGAMALALWAELVYSGLMSGLIQDMVGDATDLDAGDVQIYSEGWEQRPSLHETVDAAAILPKLDSIGFAATARLQAGGLAASGELSSGVALIGLDPARDATVLTVHEALAEGQWLDPSDDHGVVVGRGLARTLSLKPGSELIVLSQGADGSMANDLFHVRGVLTSVASSTDRGAVMMVEPTFRSLMSLPEGAHRIVVRAPKDVDLDAAVAQVAALTPGVSVKSWKQINPFMAQMLDTVKVQQKVVYFIMYVAIAILVLNAMLMALFERIREFGVLKAIGYGPAQVFSLLVLEGMLQAVVATVIGSVLALPFMYWLTTSGLNLASLGSINMVGVTTPPIWHASYTLDVVSVPINMLFFIVLAAVIYPAAKAAWIRPVEAMHHQ